MKRSQIDFKALFVGLVLFIFIALIFDSTAISYVLALILAFILGYWANEKNRPPKICSCSHSWGVDSSTLDYTSDYTPDLSTSQTLQDSTNYHYTFDSTPESSFCF